MPATGYHQKEDIERVLWTNWLPFLVQNELRQNMAPPSLINVR